MSVRLWVELAPPSFNKVGFTGNRWALTKAVKGWKEMLTGLMMAERLERGFDHIHAHVILTFPDRVRRDPENFRVVISKALGDALQEYGAIPDDTAEHFTLTLDFSYVEGRPRTWRLTEVYLDGSRG